MKVFTFRYDKESIESIGHRMDYAAKTSIPDVHENEIVCDSVSTLLKLASAPKFEIFDAIVSHRPNSLYELAQILEKDQGQVLKDTRSLEALGLIKLVLAKDGARERLTPEPLYDKIVFEVEPKKIAKSA